MNCKPGDLAVIVGTVLVPQNNGKIVRVVRRAVPGEVVSFCGIKVHLRDDRTDSWWIESEGSDLGFLLANDHIVQCRERPLGDKYLRPIRDSDDEDEMLRIAGKPRETSHA